MSGFDLTRDPMDDELHQDEVTLAVDISDRQKGTFTLTLQDIPKGKLKSLRFALGAAYAAQGEVAGIRDEVAKAWEEGADQVTSFIEKALAQGKATIASADAFAEAGELVTAAQRELVRWGLASHQAEDFRYPKAKGDAPTGTPFESAVLPWQDPVLSGPNHRMLKLYEKFGLLYRISTAVLNYQDARLLQAEAEWAQYEKRKKEAEAKAAAPKSKKKAVSPSASPQPQPTSPARNASPLPSV